MKSSVFWLSPLAWASVAALAQTLPAGGSITQGSGGISVNGATMLVQQNSARMVADWQSFSIGPGGTVRFVQPSTSSVALNRVLGSDPSQIFGSLTANGHVFLTNPNGVLFAPGAQVDVGGLVATSLNADVAQFMAGQLRLSGGGGAGAVRNEGSIAAAPGGFVVLAAPQVSNAGSIVAPGGTAALAAGSAVEVEVDPTGSGLLSIRVPASAVNARLTQSGSIVADGGRVSLQAAATDAALNTVMQVGGVVRARSIEQRDGQIVLSGGASGVVRVDGTLDASGGADVQGGTVKVLGERVALLDGARVDASGGAGGGRVLVGGAFQGQGPEPNSRDTYVARGAVLDASARDQGNGGEVVVWADGTTTYRGRIVADGGALQGDGGRVEVSGKQWLDFDGDVSLLAPRGRRGTLLLDPSSLDIGLVADVNGDTVTGDDLPGTFLAASDFAGAASRITAARVASLLATGSVQLQAANSLGVSAPITVAAGGAGSTLSLQAPNVSIRAPISLANSSLVVDTAQNFSDTITIAADVQSLGSISLTSSDVFISGATITAPAVTLVAPGGSVATVGQSATSGIVAGTLAFQRGAGSTSSVVLNGSGNRVGTLDLDVNQADITIGNPAGTPVTVQGGVAGGGSLNVDLTLRVSGGMVQGASALTVAGTTSLITTGADAVALTNPANAFSGIVGFDAGGSLSLAAQGGLSATGTAAGDIVLQSIGGPFVLPNGGVTTTGATSTIDITGAGFIDATDVAPRLAVQPGGRFFIRSSDFSLDFLGGIAFGPGPADINSIVLAGWTGAPPATGNVYFTNATGTIATPASDVAAVSKVYDGTTAFTYNQAGGAATGTFGLGSPVSLTAYNVTAAGDFADKNVGTDKAYSVAASGDSIATGSAGELYFGLGFTGFTRPALAGGALSQVTPRPLSTGGIIAVDRTYDGTATVQLDTSGLTLLNTIAGDSISLAGTPTGTMSDKSAGANKPVAVNGLSLAGADAPNYTLNTGSIPLTVNIATLQLQTTGITAADRVVDGTTAVALNAQGASLRGVLSGDIVTLDASGATGSVATPDPGVAKPVLVSGLVLGGTDAPNYSILATPVRADGSLLTVRILTVSQQAFENVRNKEYLQGVSDAQEPFRRAMAEALASGFGKENIRKQLGRGLVFETGLAPPAVDNIQPARPPSSCTAAGAGLVCGR